VSAYVVQRRAGKTWVTTGVRFTARTAEEAEALFKGHAAKLGGGCRLLEVTLKKWREVADYDGDRDPPFNHNLVR
jgi:hypothetical protein